MKGFKQLLLFSLGLALVVPLSWGLTLPYGALGEANPAKEVKKASKPKEVPVVSKKAKAESPVAKEPQFQPQPEAVRSALPPVATSNYSAPPAIASILEDVFKDGSGRAPKMLVLRGDTYDLGSTEDAWALPVLAVTVKPFAMGETEVTVGQYLACVSAGGCSEPYWRESGSEYHYQSGSDDYYRQLGDALTGENYPIIGVSWHNARQYASWLSEKTGKGYRLPSEAEWEYACRGGERGKSYCGGNDVDLVGWSGSNSGGHPHAVKGRAKNGYDLYDMSGNVSEWVEDCYEAGYSGAPVDGTARQRCGGVGRVLRGGSWIHYPRDLRSVLRGDYPPGYRNYYVGFRVARTL